MNLSSGIPVDIKTCYSTLIESIVAFITFYDNRLASLITRDKLGRVRLP